MLLAQAAARQAPARRLQRISAKPMKRGDFFERTLAGAALTTVDLSLLGRIAIDSLTEFLSDRGYVLSSEGRSTESLYEI